MGLYKTFFGQRVWPAPILRLYYPFFFSGSLAYFGFAAAHFGMMNDPNDKWDKIVDNAKKSTEDNLAFNAASIWYEKEVYNKGLNPFTYKEPAADDSHGHH
ncbi:hypothetical protein BJ742DRAFT_802974 [Cladochytrium replicatum]|nr:hypothetical protein BJ742DRAFT_802974 [Cladochytrium replicatum]